MKEQTDEVLLSVKESTETVIDEIASRREKIEGIFGERDEGEDMKVDVEGLDGEAVARDRGAEDVAVVDQGGDDLVGNRFVSLEKVEVVKEAVGDSKAALEKLSKEVGGVEVSESGGGRAVEGESVKGGEVLDSSKIVESSEGRVVAGEEGLVSTDKAEDGVTDVVDGGKGGDTGEPVVVNTENQDGVDRTNEESVQSTDEVTTNDDKISGNGDSKMDVESMDVEPPISMKEEGSGLNEKTEKETEVLDSSKVLKSNEDGVVVVEEGLVSEDKAEDGVNNESSLTEMVDKGTGEDNAHEYIKNTEIKDGVDQKNEESLESTVEDTTNGDSKMDVESMSAEPQVSMKEDGSVMNEKTVKDEALDSTKIPESLAIVDEVVVHENTENLDQKVEVDQMGKEDSLQSKEEVIPDDAVKSKDYKMDNEPQIIEEEITVKDKKEDPESGLTKETVAAGSVQEVAADGDHVMDEKSVKDDVLDSSKISHSSTMASLGLEDVDVVVVDDGLEGQNEAQDRDSVELCLVVNAGTSEVDQKVDVDPTIVTDEAAACTKIDGDSSKVQEDQGLIADPSNEGNEITASHIAVPDSTEGVPANSECSYEEAHMDRGEDAGMDIDEVLGWKDEIPSVQENEQKVDPTKKRKATDSISDGAEKQPTLHTETAEAKPLFKVGTVIQKVASQPADHVAGSTGSVQTPGPMQTGIQAEMLSQLNLTAQDPMRGHSFFKTIVPFFKSHRAAVVSKSRKRKTSNGNEPDEFEFDDVNDSYWTDRVIENHPEEQVLHDNPTAGAARENQIVAYEQENVKPPVKPTRRSNKKRFFSSNHEIEASEQSEVIARRQQNLPTEVVMKFAEGIYFPSEIHINKMFRRFGPLMESETEVDRQSGRARVVFKKCSDAEIAHSSAGTFNIFGSISVNYDLNYTPMISYKPLPLPSQQDPPHAC